MVLCIIMVLCISCRQLFCLRYILNAVVSCFVHLILPEAAANSIFPLSLAFILAPGIDKSYLRYGYALWNTMQEVILCKKASEVQNLAPLNFIC